MGKANVVVDALSRKRRINVMSLPKKLIREMEKLRWEIKDSEHEHGRIFEMLVQPRLAERVNKSQELMIERRRSEVNRRLVL